jgi:hypothetical protein
MLQIKKQELIVDDFQEARLTSLHCAKVRAAEQAARRQSLAMRGSKMRQDIEARKAVEDQAHDDLVAESMQQARRKSLAGRSAIARAEAAARRTAHTQQVRVTFRFRGSCS